MSSEDQNSPENLLRSVLSELFGIVDREAIDSIAGALTFIALVPGQVLFGKGERSEDIYFVLSGRLRAIIERPNRPPDILGEIARGESVGELALLTGEPRGASVLAVRETLVAKMTRAVFEATLARHPKVALTTMRTVVERFRRAEKARRAPERPTTLCLLGITDGVDLVGFGRRLAEARAVYGGPVTVLDREAADAASRSAWGNDTASVQIAISGLITAAEARSQALVLVADAALTPWTRACIAGADEILLVARGDAAPDVSPIEDLLRDDERAEPLARRTLVLLHAEGVRSPVGTAAWLRDRDVARHFHLRLGLARDLDRLARMLSGRGIGLVLSGGGARGFAHIGVINALAEAGIEPDVVGGTSIGSVMGAWRAMDVRGDALTRAGRRNFVEGGSPTSDFNLLPFVSLIKGYRARRLTEGSVREITGADIGIEDTWVTFFCISANYTTSTEAVLTRGPLAKSILASYAIPGALPPIPIDGHLHVDGGTVNNLPVDVMGDFGVGTIIAVDLLSDTIRTLDLDWIPRTRDLLLDRLRPRSRRRYRLPSLGEILLNASVLHSVGRQRTMRDRADLCIRPVLARVGLLEWKKFDIVVRCGHDSAAAALAGLSQERLAALRGTAENPRKLGSPVVKPTALSLPAEPLPAGVRNRS